MKFTQWTDIDVTTKTSKKTEIVQIVKTQLQLVQAFKRNARRRLVVEAGASFLSDVGLFATLHKPPHTFDFLENLTVHRWCVNAKDIQNKW